MIFAQSTLFVRLLVIYFVHIMLTMYWCSKALNWYWHVESPWDPPAVFNTLAITAPKSRRWIADVYSGRSYKSYCGHSTPVSTALTYSHNQNPERALWCSPPALSEMHTSCANVRNTKSLYERVMTLFLLLHLPSKHYFWKTASSGICPGYPLLNKLLLRWSCKHWISVHSSPRRLR